MADNIDRFGFTMCDAGTDEMITEQKGVFRTNCLDWYVSFPFASAMVLPRGLTTRQSGSHELRAGHPVPDERGAVSAPRPEGVGELKRTVVVPPRVVGREWGRAVEDICRHRRPKHELHAERKAHPRR